MKNITLAIPYGTGRVKFSLPRPRLLGVLGSKRMDGKNAGKLFSESIAEGQGRTLSRSIAGKKNILVVVPDATRKAHLETILPPLLGKIKFPGRKIDIIVATGLHKKHDTKQLTDLLGGYACKECDVLNHEQDSSFLEKYGTTKSGVPIVLNRALKNHDFIISVGVIEPHLYAGYSGGAKTVAIGLAGEETINATHGVRFLDDPLTRLGSIKKNPFQDTLWEIIRHIKIDFCVNTVNCPDGKPLKIFSGTARRVFSRAVRYADKIFTANVREPADIVICGIGYPKDANLYQASRAINYVLNTEKPILKKGGLIIVAARLKHGIGDGLSEQRFFNELRGMATPAEFVESVKKTGCMAGAHRAYMVAVPLINYRIAFVTGENANFMTSLPFLHFKNMAGALRYADSAAGKNSKIYVVQHALSTIAGLI